MNADIWFDYQELFNCWVSRMEPMANFGLLDCKTNKLYHLGVFSSKEIENMMKKSIDTSTNILLEASRNYEIPRCYEVDPNKIL